MSYIVTSNKRCFISKRKRYTQEFKEAAVKQITERGYLVAEVAERLNICTKAYITGGANYQINLVQFNHPMKS